MAIRSERFAVAAWLALIGAAPALASGRPDAARPSADNVEAKLVARAPAAVQRLGDTLVVRTRAGEKRFATQYCEDADDDRCTGYRLDRIWGDGEVFGIMVGYYEGGDYRLVTRDGAETGTGARPLASPGRRWFASAVHSDAYETEREGVHIYDAATLRVAHAIPTDRLMYPDELRWHGDACLGFRAALPADWQRKRRWWLAEDKGLWRLSRNRPARCR